jgi:hypothetical protein
MARHPTHEVEPKDAVSILKHAISDPPDVCDCDPRSYAITLTVIDPPVETMGMQVIHACRKCGKLVSRCIN